MNFKKDTLYTIGYATKPLDIFINQLKTYKINVIADVRSVPYSKVFHDYHREALINTLKAHEIRYVYLGDELGPRSKQSSHYNAQGQVQFDRLMKSETFLAGMKRLQTGLEKKFKIALVCAEKDPAICHRSLLIGYALKRLSEKIESNHILHDGNLENQSELENRLMHLTKTLPDMFSDENSCLNLSYQRQCEAHAYIRPNED